jgi:GABA(A) receptor-associated protein
MDLVGNAFSSIVGSVKSTQRKKVKPLPDFRGTHPYETRKAESTRIRMKYPDRVPIICEVGKKDSTELELDRCKYLVPIDLTVAQFLMTIRKRIKLSPENALFIFMENNTLPPTSETLGTLYANQKNDDGFLYMTISLENTFG